MQDLNDLYYFAKVVEHGGFAPAGRALGEPKSKLSRRIALLEERLGVRLIQRSTRHFSVTEVGQTFYGSSFIANHRGDLVESLTGEEGVLVHTFDLDFLDQYRAAWGFFRDRRPELYGALATGRPA